MNLRLKRTPGIYVVGFMGSGKSTVGRRLARRLGWSFFDTDDEIETAEKVKIAEIFDSRGEREFRLVETKILRHHVRLIENGLPAVLSLGGGAYVEPANRELLENNGITVWLDCPFETIKRRMSPGADRPLARDAEAFPLLFEARREKYQMADAHIPIETDDPEAVVDLILAHQLFK